MVDERVGIAVILVITVGMLALAGRLGLRPGSRMWHHCLFWSVWGVVVMTTIDLLEFGLADVPMPLVFLALTGALGGGLSGLLASFLQRRFPG